MAKLFARRSGQFNTLFLLLFLPCHLKVYSKALWSKHKCSSCVSFYTSSTLYWIFASLLHYTFFIAWLILKILVVLIFFHIPKISTHLHPITSNDNACFLSSAVHGILFSFQSKCHSDCYVWQSKAIIHLCTLCNAAFMHRNSFLFHSCNIFWNWQRAPREVESQSKHIIQAYC